MQLHKTLITALQTTTAENKPLLIKPHPLFYFSSETKLGICDVFLCVIKNQCAPGNFQCKKWVSRGFHLSRSQWQNDLSLQKQHCTDLTDVSTSSHEAAHNLHHTENLNWTEGPTTGTLILILKNVFLFNMHKCICGSYCVSNYQRLGECVGNVNKWNRMSAIQRKMEPEKKWRLWF